MVVRLNDWGRVNMMAEKLKKCYDKGEMRQKFKANSTRIKIRSEISKYLKKNNWFRKLLNVGEKII